MLTCETELFRENRPIECIYFFPVEEGAAVVGFEAEVDGRVIKAKVRNTPLCSCNNPDFLCGPTRIIWLKIGHVGYPWDLNVFCNIYYFCESFCAGFMIV